MVPTAKNATAENEWDLRSTTSGLPAKTSSKKINEGIVEERHHRKLPKSS
jgi:hypothetical protein